MNSQTVIACRNIGFDLTRCEIKTASKRFSRARQHSTQRMKGLCMSVALPSGQRRWTARGCGQAGHDHGQWAGNHADDALVYTLIFGMFLPKRVQEKGELLKTPMFSHESRGSQTSTRLHD